VLPTSCEILGVECPPHMEGRSFLPLLLGEGNENRWPTSFSEFLGGQQAARMGRFKVIYKGLHPLLFDLETDGKETTDLSAHRPIALATLRDALGLHLGRLGPVGGNDPAKMRAVHKKEDAEIDPETRRQLEELGYFDKNGE